jgi:ribonuclease P protein component
MDERLRAVERIRKKKDFIELYRKGNRFKGRYFYLAFQPNQLGYSRIGVVVSKKTGKAAIRNKIKRWFRELFRKNKNSLPKPYDLVFIARKEIVWLTWKEMVEEYRSVISRLAL